MLCLGVLMKRKIILNRILISLGTIFLIVTISFILVNLMPGDPLINIMGDDEYYKVKSSDPELLEQIAEKYGLNGSLGERYVKYMGNILRLDFGFSFTRNRPVLEVVWYRLRWTLVLAIPATVLSALFGALLGIRAGWDENGLLNRIMTPLTLVLNTIPTNCIAILFLALFSYKLRLFPISGMASGGLTGWAYIRDVMWHMCLPLTIMVMSRTCSNFIHIKSYVAQVKGEEYILAAVAKGVPKRKVLHRHVLKNAMLPYVTILCMQFGHIVSGSVMIEVVFSWVGMGNVMNTAISASDFPIMQMCFLLTAVCMVVSSVIADLLYVLLDPRIKEV